jgi:hypothetical protein
MNQTQIITSEEQVPPGWIALKQIAAEHGESARRAFSKLHFSGKVRAVKIIKTMADLRNGAVFVHPDDVRRFLNEGILVKAKRGRPLKQKQIPHSESSDGEAMSIIIDELSRLNRFQNEIVCLLSDLLECWKEK